ncbi:hypothetical protein FCM35_KLT14041 [Carex littledalei]|uniref:Uncharacterized protein n=1 Tax=Carex littledalei TaxID=544730 RepID=A0A833VDR9_9POAL|nr:hypothetical protein FCM35_KLT14041 [Carex littledalei]
MSARVTYTMEVSNAELKEWCCELLRLELHTHLNGCYTPLQCSISSSDLRRWRAGQKIKEVPGIQVLCCTAPCCPESDRPDFIKICAELLRSALKPLPPTIRVEQ